MKAMIFAAGFGKRMIPLSSLVPKPLMPFFGLPLIERMVLHLKSFGILEFIVNLHHLGRLIEERLGDGGRLGVKIRYSFEAEILGTAGGLRQALQWLGDGAFLAVNGDIAMDLDVAKMYDYHRERKAAVTLALWADRGHPRSGEVAFGRRGEIVKLLWAQREAGSGGSTPALFTGAQILEPEVLRSLPAGEYSGTTDGYYQNLLLAGVPFYGYLHEGYWADVGTPQTYLRAHMELLGGGRKAGVFGPDAGGGILMENSRPGGQVGEIRAPCYLGENCLVSKGSKFGPYAVLGKNCVVGEGASVENSVIWDNIEIGEESCIEGCIVASALRLAPGLIHRNKLLA